MRPQFPPPPKPPTPCAAAPIAANIHKNQNSYQFPAIVLLLISLCYHASLADSIYWQGTTGDWFAPNNWSLHRLPHGQDPSPGDVAYLDNGGTIQIGGGSPSASYLFIQNGTVNHSAGTNATNGLYLSMDHTGTSFYYLSGDAFLNMTYGNESVGILGGTATFTQTGGTNITYDLYIGGSAGTYSLQGGVLSVTGGEYVGLGGTGTFAQTGGTHTVTDTLIVAFNGGSSGTFKLQGGSLSAGAIQVDTGGTFTQSVQSGPSNNTVTGVVTVSGASAAYNLSGGTLTAGTVVVNNGGQFTNKSILTLTGAANSATPSGGNFKQESSGTLNIQINGTGNGQYGQIVAGTAKLDGNLNTTLGP